jgi:hypothetical protein
VPRFIDNLALRTAAWLIGEALTIALQPINERLDAIMAAVQVEQDDLDNVGTALDGLAQTLSTIDTTPLATADESKLQEGLSAVQAAVSKLVPPPAPTPTPGA